MLKPSPQALTPVAEFFKVLSEVNRLQVLCSLKSGAKNVTEIIAATGLGQANVSKQLKMLTQVGMVVRRPKGIERVLRAHSNLLETLYSHTLNLGLLVNMQQAPLAELDD